MSNRIWDQFNSAHTVCRIFSSVNISAKRRQYRNWRSLHPLPYSEVNCFANDSTTCLPYSARLCCNISACNCLPTCQYNIESSEFTATATRWRALSISFLIWRNSAGGVMLFLSIIRYVWRPSPGENGFLILSIVLSFYSNLFIVIRQRGYNYE